MAIENFIKEQYDFKKIEKKWKTFWQKNKLYEFKFDKKRPTYVVDTPPPYVSADHLHAGHIMSYSQAEFVVRYKRMQGFNVFYPMGFDDNGLPTERFVEKKYNIDKKKISKADFIKLCLKETEKGSKTYKNLWTNLGISVDWTKVYSTIAPIAQKVSQWSLIDLFKKGKVYQKKMPIMWCPQCMTAIAQADLEDCEEEAFLNHIDFQDEQGEKLTIATTRPEFIPACVALYCNKTDKRYKHLIGKKAIVPIFGHKVPIKASAKVDKKKGTGLMMVCTWGDVEDLEKWRLDKLQTRSLIEEDGRLNKLGKQFAGLKIKKAREEILKELKKQGLLVKQEKIKHVLNVHERCSTPMELVESKQWFIKLVDNKKEWLKYIKKLNWYPKSSSKIYETWVKSLKWDWCITRQRYFGVPMPVWYCEKCETPIFAKEKDLPVNPLEQKAPIKKCPKCGSTKIRGDKDVMDTWATSACTPFLLKELVEDKEVKKHLFPCSLRPNAFEIIRTWDFYSIVKSHYNFSKKPFYDVMISGHGLDEHGRKISKRLGNYMPSDQLLDLYGADAIRYWATGASLGQNLRFSAKEIKKGNRTNIKLWNVAKFLVLNQATEVLSLKQNIQYEEADLWILTELNQTVKKATENFEKYAYSQVKNEVDQFFWNKFADYYVEFVKYRLNGKNEVSKATAKSVLAQVFFSILKLYAPILPFISEELYQKLFKSWDKAQSIHLSAWPKPLILKQRFDKKGFNQAILAIAEIRAYKSKQGISLGKEIPSFKLKTKVNLKKYGEFIKFAIKVQALK